MPPADREFGPTVHEDDQRAIDGPRREIERGVRSGILSRVSVTSRCELIAASDRDRFGSYRAHRADCGTSSAVAPRASLTLRTSTPNTKQGERREHAQTSRPGFREDGASDRLVHRCNRRQRRSTALAHPASDLAMGRPRTDRLDRHRSDTDETCAPECERVCVVQLLDAVARYVRRRMSRRVGIRRRHAQERVEACSRKVRRRSATTRP